MGKKTYDFDWSDLDEEFGNSILSKAETFIKSQLKCSIAQDNRSMQSASIFMGFSAILFASSMSFLSSKEPSGIHNNSLIFTIIAMAILFFLSATFCFYSGKPGLIGLPGNEPKNWWWIKANDKQSAIGGELENYQEAIDNNDRELRERAQIYLNGIRIALSAPIIGILIWSLGTYGSKVLNLICSFF